MPRIFIALALLAVTGCDDPELGRTGRRDSGSPPRDAGGTMRDASDDPTTDGGGAPRDANASLIDAPSAVDAGHTDGGLVCRPVPTDCSPSPVTMEDYCFAGTSCYIGDVQAAVRGVIAAHPEWFDTTSGCEVILNVDGFMDDVVARLHAAGLCAIRDPNAPGEEVTLKTTNAFAENFDIVASTGCARYGPLIYTGVCFPAWW